MKILNWFFCHILGIHDYTTHGEQEIEPDKDKIKNNPVDYFMEYSALRCKNCNFKRRLDDLEHDL